MTRALLPPVIAPALLASIRQRPTLPPDTWYFVAATALSALNRPEEIGKVYTHALSHVQHHDRDSLRNEQLCMTRRMREALIKASAIGGLPKTINSLLALKEVTPPHLLDEPAGPGSSPTQRAREVCDTPSSEMLIRGENFFRALYGKVTDRVMSRMERSGTEDLGVTARLLYGYIFSNTSVLSQAETSFVLIAGLIPQDVNPQLKGHLKGARNGGATVEQVQAVRDVVIEICKASGMKRLRDSDHDGWGWRQDVANL